MGWRGIDGWIWKSNPDDVDCVDEVFDRSGFSLVPFISVFGFRFAGSQRNRVGCGLGRSRAQRCDGLNVSDVGRSSKRSIRILNAQARESIQLIIQPLDGGGNLQPRERAAQGCH